MPWPEVFRALGVQAGQARPRPQAAEQEPPPREPSAEWCAAAGEVVERAARALWEPAGREALAYLRGRGLTDETIRRWNIGFSPAEHVGLLVPGPSITIPWQIAGKLWQVKLRMLHPRAGGPRYLPLTWIAPVRRESFPAGQAHLFGVATMTGRDTGILVEGELDAVLLHQEAGGLIGVGTLGSCAASLPARAARYLLPLRRVAVAFDRDAAGREGARRLQSRFPSFERAELPAGPWKDFSEYHRAGEDLRAWVRGLLQEVAP